MNNTRAILLMVAAMASFAAVDVFIKLASATQSAGQIVAISSLAVFAINWAIMAARRERLFTARALDRALLLRSAGEVAGSVGIVIALGLVPLSTVSVMGQALPLGITFAAAVFLHEPVGWRRWTAVCLGFLGVMIILRPGLEGFDSNVLWVLLYVGGLTARDIASRLLPADISTPFAVAWAMLALGTAGLVMMPFQGGWHPIDAPTALWHLGLIAFMTLAMALITAAMRTGEVSAVAPFRYTRIVFALTAAFLFFGEVPDALTWVGAALIVGSGLYSFLRERRLRAAALARAA